MIEKTAVEIACELNCHMPGIGVCSRDKRIRTFLLVCSMAEKYTEDDIDLALEALTILMHMNKAFHKATYMALTHRNRFNLGDHGETAHRFIQGIAYFEGLEYAESQVSMVPKKPKGKEHWV
jgi:hypothetical protein